MSNRYKFIDKESVYFTTSTTMCWCDVFTRLQYKNILLESIQRSQQNQGLQFDAWVLMTKHLHKICSFKKENEPGQILWNFKYYTR